MRHESIEYKNRFDINLELTLAERLVLLFRGGISFTLDKTVRTRNHGESLVWYCRPIIFKKIKRRNK